ncbi:hypothetical protein Patl1_12449 [Pistacia atlantica]|uniref:Uncharacterized protein n=1 Tax=Pistacia atlantica TaxID=434234 RepID=A0ACC1AUW6_9ROSI|nr:hypothetical protein Patl1_12449 [Pistacia atlantica]
MNFLFLLIIYIFLNLASSVSGVQSSTFINFSSFKNDSCSNGSLICMGSVTACNGYLSLTPEPEQANNSTSTSYQDSLYKVGRVLLHQPVLAWPAVISTTFTVRISTFANSAASGDGMTFIMAENNHPSPPKSYGAYLGIMDETTKDGVVRQVAVELDTYMNEFDLDPDGNHIGIDTTSITKPVAAKSLNSTGIDLKREITVKIDYDGYKQMLHVSVGYAGKPLIKFLDQSIIMSDTVPSSVYVGFTASTGPHPESHQLINWIFTSIQIESKGQSEEDVIKAILVIVVPIVGLLIVVVFAFPFIRRTLRNKKEKKKKKVDIERRSRSAANIPKMFTYKQLQKATHNFTNDNLLGKGGFGIVYKATISNPPSIGKFDEEQVKRTLISGLACLHPDCTLRPKIRKVLQVFLNPNEPLMELPESRPSSVNVSVSSSSSSAATTNFGSGSGNALLKPPMLYHDEIEVDVMPV